MEIHTAEPSPSEVETSITKLKRYKLTGTDLIPAELIQVGSEYYVLGSINPLILLGIRKNCLSSGRSILLYQFIRTMIKLTVIIIEAYHCYQLHTKFYPTSFSQGYVHM
jgi:hypothetical protein